MTVADHEGERNPDPNAAPTNGNDVWTDGNATTYRELDYSDLRFTITSSGRAAGFLDITFDTKDAKCLFYNGTFAGGWIQDPVGGVRPVGNPSEPGSGDVIEEIGGLADGDANASLVDERALAARLSPPSRLVREGWLGSLLLSPSSQRTTRVPAMA